MTRENIATISASGADAVFNLFSGNAPLGARIAQELQTRGLVVLNSSVDRGFVGVSTYSFVFNAELASDDPLRQWSADLIRSVVIGAVVAATTYPASVSITSSNIPVVSDRTFVGGEIGDTTRSESAQGLESLNIPIIGDAISAVRKVVTGVGTTAEIALVAVAILVVGGVILVLTKPETIRKVL